MQHVTGIDGCPAFEAVVSLDLSQSGQTFRWGVTLDGPAGSNIWGIATEVGDPNSSDRYRSFVLEGGAATQEVQYYFTIGRRLGAHKLYTATGAQPRIDFSV